MFGFFLGRVIFNKFLVFLFGLGSAPYLFNKVTRSLIAKWGGDRKKMLMLLYGGFGCDKNFGFKKPIDINKLNPGIFPKRKSASLPLLNLYSFSVQILIQKRAPFCTYESRITKIPKIASEKLEFSLKKHKWKWKVIPMKIIVGTISNYDMSFQCG